MFLFPRLSLNLLFGHCAERIKLNQDEENNLSKPTSYDEIEALIKNLPIKNSARLHRFNAEFYQFFKELSIQNIAIAPQNSLKNRKVSARLIRVEGDEDDTNRTGKSQSVLIDRWYNSTHKRP